MTPAWQSFLGAQGAFLENGVVTHFGNPAQEMAAARNGSVLADLSHFDVIQFAGEEAESFLQGQLSCDVRDARLDHATLGSYCTPKGRMLATFLLWRTDEGFQMQLPAALREAIQKRISMYVMRAKVKVSNVSENSVRIGVAGEFAALPVPNQDYGVVQHEGVRVIRLPGNRYEIIASPDAAEGIWSGLKSSCTPVGSGRWEWLEIQAGIPCVYPATQEQFVPQMLNLELIGGVSFTKGCYPGQEIVARSHYLGKVKRRMVLAHLDTDELPVAGDHLHGEGPAEQSPGMIVNAQPSPEGGCDVLAVILSTALEAGSVRWKTADGPVLEMRALPYTVA